jgi:uncharacterized membrane protein YraQ (UPF0718 family)
MLDAGKLGFAKHCTPASGRVFVSGIRVVLPQEFVAKYVGSNSSNMFIPSFGVLVYFPTLVEVLWQDFLDLKQGKRPFLAYLLTRSFHFLLYSWSSVK